MKTIERIDELVKKIYEFEGYLAENADLEGISILSLNKLLNAIDEISTQFNDETSKNDEIYWKSYSANPKNYTVYLGEKVIGKVVESKDGRYFASSKVSEREFCPAGIHKTIPEVNSALLLDIIVA